MGWWPCDAAVLTQVERRRSDEGAGGALIRHQADLPLSLLLLQTHLHTPVSVRAAATQHDDEGPDQPEPCKHTHLHHHHHLFSAVDDGIYTAGVKRSRAFLTSTPSHLSNAAHQHLQCFQMLSNMSFSWSCVNWETSRDICTFKNHLWQGAVI